MILEEREVLEKKMISDHRSQKDDQENNSMRIESARADKTSKWYPTQNQPNSHLYD